MSKKQMTWHAYHAKSLCQLVDLEVRRVEIEAIKPEHELPTRRRLMKAVVGELPEEFVRACEVEVEAGAAADVACEVYFNMDSEDKELDLAQNTWHESLNTRKIALDTRQAAYQTHKAEIERLHAVECPDCPWDGETIFPEEVE